MAKWEYQVVSLAGSEAVQKTRLDDFGAAEWELVTVTAASGPRQTPFRLNAYFKRRKRAR